jgi:hypothetical protein
MCARPALERPVAPRRVVSGEFLDLGGQFSADIAGVDHVARFEQKYCGLGVGAWAVLDTARHDEKLARPEHDITISQLDGELSVKDQEELIGAGVPVPGELALDLHDPDIVVVNLGNLLRRPVLSEARQHLVQIYRFHILIVTRNCTRRPARTRCHAVDRVVLEAR